MSHIFWSLLKTDLYLFKKTIKDKLINALTWSSCNMIISTYFLQLFGMSENFGVFQFGGQIISLIGFEIYSQLFNFISDLEGNKHINYHLTLPISNWLLFVKYTVFSMINNIVLCLATIPVSKLILWNKLELASINWPLLFLAIIAASIFFAAFTLFLSSIVKAVYQIENIFCRILLPLWMFGGFQFSWKGVHALSPILSYLMLISPYTFATEATRSSIMGSANFIPYWINIAVLLLAAVAAWAYGYNALKKKLDFVG